MKLAELKQEIMDNSLDSIYIFTGDEIGIMNIYLNQMAKQNALEIVRVDTVLDAVGMVQSSGFFDNTSRLLIVRDDKDFTKNEDAWEVVNTLKENILVLLFDKLDSRLKFSKKFKDVIVDFEPLPKDILARYIVQQSALSLEKAEQLADLCVNYDVAMQECIKIRTYSKITKCKTDWCMDKLLEDGTIYQPQDTDVFAFTDAVSNRQVKLSFELGRRLKESGTSAINALGTLYNTMKAVMLIQCCDGDIEQVTGLSKGEIYFNKKKVGKYDIYSLVYAVQFIAQTVSDIKSGRIEDKDAIDYVLCNIL